MRSFHHFRSQARGPRRMIASASAVAVVYVGLPLYLAAMAVVRPRPWVATASEPHSVTVVIAAHNEVESIAAKLDDIAAQRGDRRLQVIVASDGSTDGTVDVAGRHASRPVVLDLERGGKAAALNAAIERAEGEVVVFSD